MSGWDQQHDIDDLTRSIEARKERQTAKAMRRVDDALIELLDAVAAVIAMLDNDGER